MTGEDLCIHDDNPAHCTICLGKNASPRSRRTSTISQDRFLTCPICSRSQSETKFPTDKSQERRTDMCRECEVYLREQRKAGVDRAAAVEKRRRQFL